MTRDTAIVPNPDMWKGIEYWKNAIIKAGLYDQLRHFNDVLTGNEPPGGYGEPVLKDVIVDGRQCDIYHTDKKNSDTFARVFIHIKT